MGRHPTLQVMSDVDLVETKRLEAKKASFEAWAALFTMVVSGVTLAVALGGLAKQEPPKPRQPTVHVHRFPFFEELVVQLLVNENSPAALPGFRFDTEALKSSVEPNVGQDSSPTVESTPGWRLGLAGGAFGALLFGFGLVFRRR